MVFIKCFRSTLWLLVLWGQGCLTLRGTEPEASQLKEKEEKNIYTHSSFSTIFLILFVKNQCWKVMKTQQWVLPFSVQQLPSAKSQRQHITCVAKSVKLHHEPTKVAGVAKVLKYIMSQTVSIRMSMLWELIFKAKKLLLLRNTDRTAKWSMLMKIVTHF